MCVLQLLQSLHSYHDSLMNSINVRMQLGTQNSICACHRLWLDMCVGGWRGPREGRCQHHRCPWQADRRTGSCHVIQGPGLHRPSRGPGICSSGSKPGVPLGPPDDPHSEGRRAALSGKQHRSTLPGCNHTHFIPQCCCQRILWAKMCCMVPESSAFQQSRVILRRRVCQT